MKKIIFEKEYTRDYSLMMEEMWDRALCHGPFGNSNPHSVKNIYYINDGVMEVWENREAVNWYKEELLKKNQKDEYFFNSKMDEYEVLLAEMESIWSKESTRSLDELKFFVKLATRAMDYFIIFYYSAMDQRNSQSILDRANIIRDKDNFFDKADNFIRKSVAKIYPTAKKFANTLSANDLSHMPQLKELEARYQNYVVDMGKASSSISLQDFADKNKYYKFLFEEGESGGIVKGQIAFKGKALGRIRILRRKDQINDFKEREILLSPMTTPDFIPAMKKAAAIVTDEGGIICHAAIIARELKIPCVIGTKVATRVFKDGDMVEVDANNGIVKKL